MQRDLAIMADMFREDGYCLLVSGPGARRFYLGQAPGEPDIWTNADILYVARRLDGELSEGGPGGGLHLVRGERRFHLDCDPLVRCTPGGMRFDLLKTIARRRVFTVDALLYDPLRDRFLDPLGARMDIRHGVLRLTGEPEGTPAQLRDMVLAGVCLECEEQFVPGRGLIDFMRQVVGGVTVENPRELAGWLVRVVTARMPYAGLSRLDELGLLGRIVPELEALKGCPQDKEFHPEGDVFTHTLECFRHVKHPSPALGLGLLLHDIGKPETLTVDRNLHFPRHSSVGAMMARRILRRLGIQPAIIDEVEFFIRNHLLWRVMRGLSEGQVAALARHPWFENLLRLYRADIQGSMGDLIQYRKLLRLVAPYRVIESH